MAHEKRRAALLKKHNLKGVNKPKRTPDHKTKSHMVLAQQGHELKLIRFGQQGVRGAGKNPKTAKDKARKKSYYARHNAQDSKPDIMSARYWSHKVKWQEKPMGDKEYHKKEEEAKKKVSKSDSSKKNKKSSGSSKKMSLTQWINSQLKDKGMSASAAKKNAGKYKSISAAKKAGSLYYTNPKGTVMIAAFASDLDNIPTKKKKPTDSKEAGKQRYDMRRSAEKAAEQSKTVFTDEQKRSSKIRPTVKTIEVKAIAPKTDMTDAQKARGASLGARMTTIENIRNLLPELEQHLSERDMKAIRNILSGKSPMSEKSKIDTIKRRVKKSGAMNVGGLTSSPMMNGLSRKINPTTGLTMNKGGMTDYRKTGMFYGGGMARRGRQWQMS